MEGGPAAPPGHTRQAPATPNGHALSAGSAGGLLELELAGVRRSLVTPLSLGAQFLGAGVVSQVPCQKKIQSFLVIRLFLHISK